MPPEDERPENAPDTSETYERGHPSKEPGLGEVDTPERADDDREDHPQSSTHNPDRDTDLAGEDQRDGGDAVDPASDVAHGDRPDPSEEK